MDLVLKFHNISVSRAGPDPHWLCLFSLKCWCCIMSLKILSLFLSTLWPPVLFILFFWSAFIIGPSRCVIQVAPVFFHTFYLFIFCLHLAEFLKSVKITNYLQLCPSCYSAHLLNFFCFKDQTFKFYNLFILFMRYNYFPSLVTVKFHSCLINSLCLCNKSSVYWIYCLSSMVLLFRKY